jgi:RNase H-like domain found in reverse transcriptase
MQEHNKNLMAVINRLHESGLTVRKDKMLLSQPSLTYFGHEFSSQGVGIDKDRLTALDKMSPPRNAAEVRSLLGMFGYNSRHIHQYATLTDPLRKLTHADAKWQWTAVEQQAFDTLRARIHENTITAYFDPNRRSQVIVDASPVGVAAILSQPDDNDRQRPIIFVSRALTDVEQRYSQTEREALAIVFAVERLHIYLYNSKFELFTDHKPLVVLFGNPAAKLSARMERWRMRIQAYTFRIIYQKGQDNAADYMSRHPVTAQDKETGCRQTDTDDYVNFIASNAVPKSITLEEIRSAALLDPIQQQIITAIGEDNWHQAQTNSDLKPYYRIRNELSVTNDGIILRGTRIVMPLSLQLRTLQIAHEAHFGLVKTKMALREKVWFVGMDK